VPASDKEKKRKTGKIDARKISRGLCKGELKEICVPEPAMEEPGVWFASVPGWYRIRPVVRTGYGIY
jgi:hypothetical protein